MLSTKLILLAAVLCTVSALSTTQQQHRHPPTNSFAIRTTSSHQYPQGIHSPWTSTSSTHQFSQRRTLPVLHSAKIVPVAYTAAAASLFVRVSKGAAAGLGWSDRAVLASTAFLALFHLGPTNNRYLKSSKRAIKKLQNSDTPDDAKLTAAKQWRTAVRIKVIGQFLGLVWMSVAAASTTIFDNIVNSILLGATVIMATNLAFYGLGAGSVMHDDMGNAKSVNDATLGVTVGTDIMMTVAGLVAAFQPIGSILHTLSIRLFVGGALFNAVEGGQVGKFFKNLKKKASAV